MQTVMPNYEIIFCHKFTFYTSSIYEICLHCHWLGFSSIILNFEQCERDLGVHYYYKLGNTYVDSGTG